MSLNRTIESRVSKVNQESQVYKVKCGIDGYGYECLYVKKYMKNETKCHTFILIKHFQKKI